jgi:hypothetical protein
MESQKKIRKEILHVINEYYESWLHQSNMNEEELLTYRSGEKFSIQVEKDIFYRFKMVCVLNGKMANIGETIVVPQNEETLMDAIYLMLFISKKLDDANKKDTAYGSYEGAYFSDKVREFAKAFLKEWRCL